MPYIAEPSPRRASTGRSGQASCTPIAAVQPPAQRPAPLGKIPAGVLQRPDPLEVAAHRRGGRLFDHGHVVRQHPGELRPSGTSGVIGRASRWPSASRRRASRCSACSRPPRLRPAARAACDLLRRHRRVRAAGQLLQRRLGDGRSAPPRPGSSCPAPRGRRPTGPAGRAPARPGPARGRCTAARASSRPPAARRTRPAAGGPRATRTAAARPKSGWSDGKLDRPCDVVASWITGAPSRSATATSSSTAPASQIAAAHEDARVGGRGQHARPRGGRPPAAGGRWTSGTAGGVRSSPSAAAICTSSGSERNTGPVGGVMAVCTARRTADGRSSTRRTSAAHLVHGRDDVDHVAPEDRLLEQHPLVLLPGGHHQRRARRDRRCRASPSRCPGRSRCARLTTPGDREAWA